MESTRLRKSAGFVRRAFIRLANREVLSRPRILIRLYLALSQRASTYNYRGLGMFINIETLRACGASFAYRGQAPTEMKVTLAAVVLSTPSPPLIVRIQRRDPIASEFETQGRQLRG